MPRPPAPGFATLSEQRAHYERVETITHNLYESMPGAPDVPKIDGDKMWGDVEHTQHYEFCNTIAHLIVSNSGKR